MKSFSAFVVVVAAACGGSPKQEPVATPVGDQKPIGAPAVQPDAAPAPVARITAPVAFVADDGFPQECLDYRDAMQTLMKCDKMKAGAAAMQEAFDNSWESMRAMPADSKAAMGPGCKAGLDAIKTTIVSAGC